MFITYSDGINNHITKYNFNTKKTSDIKLPFSGTANIYTYDTKTNNCIARITSWNKPFTEFMYNAETDVFTPSVFNKPCLSGCL